MTLLLAALALCAAGYSLLRLLGLETRRLAVDAPLAWLVGGGWFALACLAARFGLGVAFAWPLAAAVLALPPVAWGALRLARARAGAAPGGRDLDGRAAGVAAPPARWLPRPPWLWAPVVAYVVVVLGAVTLQGVNTPTNTDDGVRVRAFTPMLAHEDAWPPEARALLTMAGPVPTFVPATAWAFTGTVDHFHVNYVVLLDLLAFLALVVALCSSRGSPERGWGSAAAVLSVPLFVYHCTTTYQDAVLAMLVGAGVLFAMEHLRLRDERDLARALLVLGVAAMVKREGELVAGSLIVALLAHAAWRRVRGGAVPLLRLALLVGVPAAVLLAAKISAVGVREAAPLLAMLAARAQAGGAAAAAAAAAPQGSLTGAAADVFGYALFRSGNAGAIYAALLATVAVRARALARPWLGGSLALVALVLAENAVSSIWFIPQFTVNEGTVHRALLVATVPAALWLAAALADAVWPEAATLEAPGGPGRREPGTPGAPEAPARRGRTG